MGRGNVSDTKGTFDRIRALLEESSIAPTPSNYEFLYRYVTGADLQLVEAVDAVRRTTGKLTDRVLANLRRELYGTGRGGVGRVLEDTEAQLARMNDYIERSDAGARNYVSQLDVSQLDFDAAATLERQRAMLAKMVEATNTMLATTEQLQAELAASSREIDLLKADLEIALHGTLALDLPARRLSRLIEFLDSTDPEGIHARLARWCEVSQGDYAWVFDNGEDSVVARIAERAVIGFDVTDFLENDLTRAPVTLYLFHLVRQLLDGRRLVCWMDEFWRLLADPAFESFAKDGPKTWRKLNGVMCLATQSPSDVLSSPISRTVIEQTPTKIFFPNANADPGEYASLGLTGREFRVIHEQLEPASRCFLVKQGQRSVVCQLDLKGFESELRVISGRMAQVRFMERLIEEHHVAVRFNPLLIAAACIGRHRVGG